MRDEKLGLHLVKVLRFVDEDPIFRKVLIKKIVNDQKITVRIANQFLQEVIELGYLSIKPGRWVVKGDKPFPEELKYNSFYEFSSECWNCGKVWRQTMSIHVNSIWWNCIDCSCKWVTHVDSVPK